MRGVSNTNVAGTPSTTEGRFPQSLPTLSWAGLVQVIPVFSACPVAVTRMRPGDRKSFPSKAVKLITAKFCRVTPGVIETPVNGTRSPIRRVASNFERGESRRT